MAGPAAYTVVAGLKLAGEGRQEGQESGRAMAGPSCPTFPGCPCRERIIRGDPRRYRGVGKGTRAEVPRGGFTKPPVK